MHSALGAGIAAIKHEDIAAGAIAAPLGEVIAERFGAYAQAKLQADLKEGKISAHHYVEKIEEAKRNAIEVAKVGTAVAALFTGHDVNTAVNAASNAAENNFIPVLVAAAVIGMQIATVVDVVENSVKFKEALDKDDVDGAIAAGVGVALNVVPGQKLIPAPIRNAVKGAVTKAATKILHSKYGKAAVKAGGELVDAAGEKVQGLTNRMANSKAGQDLANSSLGKGFQKLGDRLVQHVEGSAAHGVEKGVDLSPRVKQNYWDDVDHFTAHGQTNKVYKRDDLIDLNKVDELGRTNLQRMQKGLSPKGPDGEPINLHHMLQTHNGPIAEVTDTFHKEYSKIIHINPPSIPSGIDRPDFNKWRSEYWKARAPELSNN